MKKRILALLAASTLVIGLLAGCGGNNAPAETPATPPAETPAPDPAPEGPTSFSMRVWAPQNQIDNDFLKNVCQAWADKNGYTVDWTFEVVGEDVAKDEILRDISMAGDVFHFANDQLEELADAGALLRLGPDQEQQIKDNFPSEVQRTVMKGDAYFAFPFTHNTFFMFYNKDLLTADDVKTMEGIMAVDTPDGAYNFAFSAAGGWMLSAWYYGAGLHVFGPNGDDRAAGSDWNSQTGVDVTMYIVNLLNDPNVIFEPGNLTELIADGRLGAWFDGSWNNQTYVDALGDSLGYAKLPTFNLNGTDTQLLGFYGSKAIGVNAQSANPAQAMSLAAWLASDDVQHQRFMETGTVPASNTASASPEVQADPVAAVIIEEVNYASVMQPTAAVFGANFWSNVAGFVDELRGNLITADNVQERLDALVSALSGT